MLTNIRVKDFMTERVVTLKPNQGVIEAIQILLKKRIRGAPVLDDHGNIIGMFSEADCMDVLLRSAYDQSMAGTVADYMSTERVVTVECDTSIVEVAEMFAARGSWARNFPVLEDVHLIGVISRVDVLRALTSELR